MQTIFCPACAELMLSEPACPACGWRPTTAVGSLLWRAETGCRLSRPCTPIIVGNFYVLPTEDGSIIGIELQSDRVAWKYPLRSGSSAQAIAQHGDLLFVGACDTQPVPQGMQKLLALHPQTGAEVWSFEVAAHSLSTPAADQYTIYFTTSTGKVVALNAQTRQEQWTASHTGWGPAAPGLGEGLVVAGGRGESLLAYRADDGRQCWQITGQGWFATTPQIQNGRVFAWCWDGQLYALDAASGKVLWQQRGERDRGFTSAPLAAGPLVLIGSRVHPPADAPGGPRYALLAYHADSGALAWRFFSSAPICVPPARVEHTVLVVSDAGELAALDLGSGEELWRADKAHVGRRVVAQPQITGNRVLLAEPGGTCTALQWTDAHPPLLAPETYLKRGDRGAAAAAYALQGAFETAAELYLQLDRPHEAAQLFARADQPLRAGELWEQAGELRRAAEIYESIGDWEHLAGVLEASGEPLRAAQLYEQHGQLSRAAQLYEQAGDRIHAAELYEQSGHHQQVQTILTTLDSWEQQAALSVKVGNLTHAAIILEQHGQLERAALLYAQTGAGREELRLRVQLADWQRAAELALQLDEHVQAAGALFRLGKRLEAADAHQRAAQSFEQLRDEQRAIAQYEQATELYQAVGEDEQANLCRANLRRLQRQPELRILYTTEIDCYEDRWSKFQFQIENIGYGLARAIKVSIQGMFQVDGNEVVPRLAAREQYTHTLSLQPYKETRGSVPIWVSINYQDRHNTEYSVEKRLFVNVCQPQISPVSPSIGSDGDIFRVGQPQVSPISPSHSSSSEIFRLNERLKTYRENLGDLLEQQARVGKSQVSLEVIRGIREARDAIHRLKHILRLRNEPVIDMPEDTLDY